MGKTLITTYLLLTSQGRCLVCRSAAIPEKLPRALRPSSSGCTLNGATACNSRAYHIVNARSHNACGADRAMTGARVRVRVRVSVRVRVRVATCPA